MLKNTIFKDNNKDNNKNNKDNNKNNNKDNNKNSNKSKKIAEFLKYKSSFHHRLLFELFYEKNNYLIIPYELFDQIFLYYSHLLQMIYMKKSIKSTDLNTIQLKIGKVLDLVLHKSPFLSTQELIERSEYINERNKFYKYMNQENIFIKKVSYVKYKINEFEYEVEFDIFDKLNELLIQTNIYKYYEIQIEKKKMYYNPIPKIYQFYHNISEIDINGNILNNLYIEMEEIDGLRLDTYLNKKICRPKDDNINHSLKDILNIYIMICRLLIPLQKNLGFIHCDLKGSNILIGKDRKLRFIDFEYSYIKRNGFHLFSHDDFYFENNYNIFTSNSSYTLDLIKLYTSPYRFCSDLLYLFLTTLSHKSDTYGIQRYLIEHIFKIGRGINIYDILITHKLPYEAYVYSKDMELLKNICNMYFVNFEEFIMRFYPENMINILNNILYNIT